MPDWIYQLSLTAISAMCGIIMTVLRRGIKNEPERWLNSITYGLVAAASVAILISESVSWMDRAKLVNTRNVESSVNTWIKSLGLTSTPLKNEKYFFHIEITRPNNFPIAVSRLHDEKLSGYLLLVSQITTGPEHKKILTEARPEQVREFWQCVSLEMARADIDYSIMEAQHIVTLEKRLPITETLTDADFINNLNEIFRAQTVLNAVVNSETEKILRESNAR